jgi:hypothetical protein
MIEFFRPAKLVVATRMWSDDGVRTHQRYRVGRVVKARDKSKMAVASSYRWIVLRMATAELLGEPARCDNRGPREAGSPSRRHDRTSPAPADVSTVDTLPTGQPASGATAPEHGPAWEGRRANRVAI